jgi:hypothetical protein
MENVFLKHIVDNPDAQNSFFQKVFKRGQILAIVYFCIILVTKGRSEFDKYSKLSDCFGDHRNEIRIALENIGKFIHAVKSNSKASSNRYTEAEVVGGRLRSTKRRKRTGKTRKNRYNSFHGGEPPAKPKLKFDIRSFLIVSMVSFFFNLLFDKTTLKLLSNSFSTHRTQSLKEESLRESLRRSNKKGPNRDIFLDVHAHGLNIKENMQLHFDQHFAENSVKKFRPHVSDQVIYGPSQGTIKQALSYGFYNYWINSNRLDEYHFSENIDPAIEMLEEYLNSNMHASLQQKFMSLMDYSLKDEASTNWALPSGDRKLEMLPLLNKTWLTSVERYSKDNPNFDKSEAGIIDTRTDDEVLRTIVDLFCQKANSLGLDLDLLSYDGPHTSVDDLRSQYCIVSEEPNENMKILTRQKQYYEDGLKKSIPQGYGRQLFEKAYSFKTYKKIEDSHKYGGYGITIMLTTNLSDQQLKKLSKITAFEDAGNSMYYEDITESYNDFEDYEEPMSDWDSFANFMEYDIHKKITINPKHIPNVAFEETEKYTEYEFYLSDLVSLLKSYDIENIYIHEYACDGYDDPDFIPREDQKHINTIKQLGGTIRNRSRRRRTLVCSRRRKRI